jgi:hypothetical protein
VLMRYVHVRFKNICGVVLGEGALNYSNRAFGGKEKRASTWSSSPSPFSFSSLIPVLSFPPSISNPTHLNHLNQLNSPQPSQLYDRHDKSERKRSTLTSTNYNPAPDGDSKPEIKVSAGNLGDGENTREREP